MADDVLLNKAAAIERAVRRVREEYAEDDRNLLDNQTRQDAIILNLQRACEGSVDAAMHLVRVHRLGVPQETREAFVLLEQAQLLAPPLADRLKKMVGFRT
ncbi:MAG: type VII toxin-antitoxin system HepT family RNase toxin, partial [Vicinamibacterales bacterium]